LIRLGLNKECLINTFAIRLGKVTLIMAILLLTAFPVYSASTSSYFTPEVAILNVSIQIHEGLGSGYYGSVSHYIVVDVWTNTPQKIDLYLRLFNTQGKTISEKVVRGIQLTTGVNTIHEWLKANIQSDFEKVTVYAKIVRFEKDTDLRNNDMVGNTVILKKLPYIYAEIIWKPVKQKIRHAILPGDEIEVDFKYVIPFEVSGVGIRAFVGELDPETGRIVAILDRSEIVYETGPKIIWKNFTITVPFTKKILLSANVTHPSESTKNSYLYLFVASDTGIMEVEPATTVVKSGSMLPITVRLTSNEIGNSIRIYVDDLDLVKSSNSRVQLESKEITITKPEMTVTINVKVPEVKGSTETHRWEIHVGSDAYIENNYRRILVTIEPAGKTVIPGFDAFLAVMAVTALAILRKLG